MNFFTPELGPPLAANTDLEEWRQRVTSYLNGLRQVLDTQMIAYINSPAQIAPNVIGGQSLAAVSVATQTANLGLNGTTMLTFTVDNSAPGLASAACTAAGWFVSMSGSTTAVQRVNVLNSSGSTAGATIYLRYFN